MPYQIKRPPIPGAPWSRQAEHFVEPGPQVSQARIPQRGPLVPRVPDPADVRRLATFSERVSSLLNSLIVQGYIRSTGINTYSLLGGALINTRPPTVNDDAAIGAVAGCAWVDILEQRIWFCLQADIGAAIWSAAVESLNGLTTADQTFARVNDDNVYLTISSTGSVHTFAMSWGGTLTVTRGGTGASSFTAHGPLLGEGISAVVAMAAGTNAQMILGQTGADPAWRTMIGDASLAADGTITVVPDLASLILAGQVFGA